LYPQKEYTAQKLLKEFQGIRELERVKRSVAAKNCSVDRRPWSVRQWTACNAQSVVLLMTSCSARTVRHKQQSVLEISRNIGICRSLVGGIIPWSYESHPPRGKQRAYSLTTVFSCSV